MKRKGLPSQLKEGCVLFVPGDVSIIGESTFVGKPLYSDSNLVRFYSMNSLSEKNGFDFTNSGCVSVAGKFGTAYSTGNVNVNSYLNNPTNVGINGGAVTITAWIKVNGNHSSSDHPMAVLEASPSPYMVANGIGFDQTNTGVYFNRLRENVAWDSLFVPIAPGNGWKHYAYTYDGATIRGYVNGNPVGSVGASGNGVLDHIRNGASMGGWNVNATEYSYCSVDVDEFAIFNRALSDAEIKEIAGYDALVDASGHGNHGTPVNSPTKVRGGLHGYKGLKFNGTNQYVTVPSNADTVIGTSDFTFSVTAKFDDITSARCLISKMNEYYAGATIATGFAFGIADVGFSNWSFGFATWEGNANTGVNGAYNEYYGLKMGVPARVSCIRRGTSHEVWLNGVMVLSATGTVRNVTNPYPLNLGRYNWTYEQYFKGVMSNPIFELRALSKEEMQLDAGAFFIP